MDYQLQDKLCLVSGSTAGIGLAIATALAGEGAQVIVNGRTDDRVAEAIDRVRKKHPKAKLKAFAGDLSKADQVTELDERFQRLDVLVNNLGIYEPKPFEKLTDADWLAVIETNFFSGLRLSRAFLPGMLNRNWGRIIFISSESGVNIPPEMIHYGVTKAMQIALARGLAETTKGTGVTVNSVLPGPTRSEGVGEFPEEHGQTAGQIGRRNREGFLYRPAAEFASATLRHERGSGPPGRLRGQCRFPRPPTARPFASKAACSDR